ncbi:creatininase family protein [Amycolatopsis pithecellobii]|uniref:Amidohydrolase n=1 Tax=Amycolatopsis pithecellobii TaxID=664692 RepID=A0A6N7Z508_9PSEU|nr:creatininase family protein [Amycolatopsis pithecellobii]MTD54426.1 amidohydrolase [Amycolatopsis pithecellobii]
MTARIYAEFTSAEVVEAVRGATLVWPVGSTEQHGPHLPLSVDAVLAESFAYGLADRLDAIVLPTVTVGARSLPQSGGGLAFPGTLYAAGPELIRYLAEVLRSLARLPFARLVVLNGHFENEALLLEALDEACRDGGLADREVLAFSWWSLVDEQWARAQDEHFPGWHAEHAGHTETSLMLHLRPDLVRPARPEHKNPPPAGVYVHPIDVAAASTDGVLSRTSGASAEAGAALFEHVVRRATERIATGFDLIRRAHS